MARLTPEDHVIALLRESGINPDRVLMASTTRPGGTEIYRNAKINSIVVQHTGFEFRDQAIGFRPNQRSEITTILYVSDINQTESGIKLIRDILDNDRRCSFQTSTVPVRIDDKGTFAVSLIYYVRK